MAQQIVTKQEMDMLLAVLRDHLPESIMTFSMVKNLSEGKFMYYKIYVDTCPNPSTVAVVPDRKVCQSPHHRKRVFLFGNDSQRLHNLVNFPGVIDWNSELLFFGISLEVWTILESTFKSYKNGYLQEPGDNFMYFAKSKDIILNASLPEGLELGPMAEETMNSAISVWKFYEDGFEDYFRELIACGIPTLCLYDKCRKPVGWVLQQMSGEVGMLYVFPEHRGKGYGKFLLSKLIKIMIERDGCACSFVATNNSISCKLHERLGMVKMSGEKDRYMWQRFRYRVDD